VCGVEWYMGNHDSFSETVGKNVTSTVIAAAQSPLALDPVASTTPSGLPAWGPRSARGSETNCDEFYLLEPN